MTARTGSGCCSTRSSRWPPTSARRGAARIVEAAGELVDARYAALGVLARPGQRLRTFVNDGMRGAGRGDRGASARARAARADDRPTRAAAPSRHHRAPGVVRLPANHPPMHSFLGVPVRIRDKVFGNLYLTEKVGGATSPRRTRRSWSPWLRRRASPIENARLYDEATRREQLARGDSARSPPCCPRATRAPMPSRRSPTGRVRSRTRTWPGFWPARTADLLRIRATSGSRWPGVMRALPLERSLAGVVVHTGARVASRTSPPTRGARHVAGSVGPASAGCRGAAALRRQVDGALALGWTRERADGTTRWTRRCRPASPSTRPWRCRSRGPARTVSGWRCWRTGTGSDATCTTWSSSGCSRSGWACRGPPGGVDRPEVATRLDQAVDDSMRRSTTSVGRSSPSQRRRLADIQAEVTRLGRPGGRHLEVPAHAAVRRDRCGPSSAATSPRRARRARRGTVQRQPARGRARPWRSSRAGDDVVLAGRRRRPRARRASPRERAAQHA